MQFPDRNIGDNATSCDGMARFSKGRSGARRGLRVPQLARVAGIAAAAIAATVTARADAFVDWVAGIYKPFQADQVALAPDGKHVAFTKNAPGGLQLVLLDVDNPRERVTINVAENRIVKFSKEKEPPKLQFLEWASAEKIVFAPTEYRYGSKLIMPVFVANADGADAKELVNPTDVADEVMIASQGEEDDDGPQLKRIERPLHLLGFSAADRSQLLVEAMGQRPPRSTGMSIASPSGPPPPLAPTAVFKVDIVTGKLALVGDELNEGKFYYDWSGEPRLIQWHTDYFAKQTYSVRDDNSFRWQDLTKVWPEFPATAFTVMPETYFDPHAYPLAIDFDPNVIYLASNLERDTFAIESFNLVTKQRKTVASHPHFDLATLTPPKDRGTLVFDQWQRRLAGVRTLGFRPETVWVDPEIGEIQRLLEHKLPDRVVEVLGWDEKRQRFLVRSTAASDPGRYFVFTRKEGLLTEFLRRAPWLHPAELNQGKPFEFDSPAGVHLTGYVTFPRKSRVNPPPVVVFFPEGIFGRVSAEFDREAQALAETGLIVIRLNPRGAGGQGIKHRAALVGGFDRLPVDDAVATVEWAAKHFKFDRRRVAVMGQGYGGYLALRAAQLQPGTFRCAIAIDAPLDLESWLRPGADEEAVDLVREAQRRFFQRGTVPLRELSVLRDVESLTNPVMLIVTPNADEITAQNDQLRSRLQRLHRPAEFVEIGEDFERGLAQARAEVFLKIEEFFNLNLYRFKVDVGPTTEVK